LGERAYLDGDYVKFSIMVTPYIAHARKSDSSPLYVQCKGNITYKNNYK
jgi:hypothetical protein